MEEKNSKVIIGLPILMRQDASGILVIRIRHLSYLRKKADEEFMDKWGKVYGKRNIVESVFSAMKRRFGGEIWSRKEELKFKEMLLVVVAYNAWKFYFWLRFSTMPQTFKPLQ